MGDVACQHGLGPDCEVCLEREIAEIEREVSALIRRKVVLAKALVSCADRYLREVDMLEIADVAAYEAFQTGLRLRALDGVGIGRYEDFDFVAKAIATVRDRQEKTRL